MLLYHFPLISSFENKGYLKSFDYDLTSSSTGGKISSSCYKTEFTLGSAICFKNLLDFKHKTVCFRFKPISHREAYQCVLWTNYSVSGDTNRAFIQFKNNGSKKANYRVPTGTYSEFTFNKQWYDIVLVEGDTHQLYIDGVLVQERVQTNNHLTEVCIGARSRESDIYATNMYVQDIRIYDYALSQAEINEYSRALVVHYPLQGNELNPSVLKDVSGFGNDMQRYGGSSSYDNNSPRADKSLHLVNANHCYYQGDMKWSDFTNFTISVWIYSTNNSNYRGAIGMHATVSGANRGVAFAQWQEGTFRFTIFSGTATAAIRFTPISLNLNSWYFFSVTYDGNIGKLYMNGNIKEELTKAVEPLLDQPISLGRAYNDINRNWDGNISDVRIYATALSAEDIKNLYNSPISVSNQHQTMAFEFVEGNDGFSVKKNGIVQHNELRENDSDVNGCYNDKLITNELIEK